MESLAQPSAARGQCRRGPKPDHFGASQSRSTQSRIPCLCLFSSTAWVPSSFSKTSPSWLQQPSWLSWSSQLSWPRSTNARTEAEPWIALTAFCFEAPQISFACRVSSQNTARVRQRAPWNLRLPARFSLSNLRGNLRPPKLWGCNHLPTHYNPHRELSLRLKKRCFAF